MASDFRKFDEHGFPLAPRFEELKFHDAEPPRRLTISARTKRLVMFVLVVGVLIPVLFGSKLVATGKDLLAHWYESRAQQKYLEHDFPGALADLSSALEWNPQNFELRLQRAFWRADQSDLTGSLADWTECITLIESATKRSMAHDQFSQFGRADLGELYTERSWINVRLGRAQQAIADANKAIEIKPSSENLNSRAYARAVLNVDLPDGLNDIQKAMDEAHDSDPEMLDTRGYLLHLLNRNEEALADLQRAIDRLKNDFNQDPFDSLKRMQIRRSLAVMYHHRGLVFEQLGRTAEAEQDRKHGDRLGYDPQHGVL